MNALRYCVGHYLSSMLCYFPINVITFNTELRYLMNFQDDSKPICFLLHNTTAKLSA
jgi:hypothetical protein